MVSRCSSARWRRWGLVVFIAILAGAVGLVSRNSDRFVIAGLPVEHRSAFLQMLFLNELSGRLQLASGALQDDPSSHVDLFLTHVDRDRLSPSQRHFIARTLVAYLEEYALNDTIVSRMVIILGDLGDVPVAIEALRRISSDDRRSKAVREAASSRLPGE